MCYCEICQKIIFAGEDYVRNHEGYYAHYECVSYIHENSKVEEFFDITGGEMPEYEDDYKYE